MEIKQPPKSVIFSSQLSDITVALQIEEPVVVSLTQYEPTNSIFSSTLYPSDNLLHIRNIKEIVEEYMRAKSLSVGKFRITATGSVTEESATCEFLCVCFSMYTDTNAEKFVSESFLTTTISKLTPKGSVERITGWFPEETDINISCVCRDSDGNTEVKEFTWIYGIYGLVELYVNYSEISELAGEGLTPIAYSVHAGPRSVAFYVDPEPPGLCLSYRNAFNAVERCFLHGITTKKTEPDAEIAQINGLITEYNRSSEFSMQVETAPLDPIEARCVEQLFISPDVRLCQHSQYVDGKQIAITDVSCELSDKEGESDSVKFTWKYRHRQDEMPTPAMTDNRIFTNEYNHNFY